MRVMVKMKMRKNFLILQIVVFRVIKQREVLIVKDKKERPSCLKEDFTEMKIVSH